MTNRIFFLDNPWPAGHAVENLVWDGRLNSDGTLWFDLHLESADYDADDPEDLDDEEEDEDDESDWTSKAVWTNYGRCKISSTDWHFGGWQVGAPSEKFDWNDWQQRVLHIDPAEDSLPEDQEYQERAFHIYLLGHDAVADHCISFQALDKQTWQIDWKGKIALAYTGNYDLEHRFETVLEPVQFGGFNIEDGIDDQQAWSLFREAVAKPECWQLVSEENRRRFIQTVS